MRRLAILLLTASIITYSLVACVKKYDVRVTNQLDAPAVVRIGQYRSPGFDGTAPKEFIDALRVQQQTYTLAPGETRKLSWHDASGGFWLRWSVLVPPREENVFTLDLIRDERQINIR
jgi:hypothetical protein